MMSVTDMAQATRSEACTSAWRRSRVLFACLVASAALHAAVFASFLGFERTREPPLVRVLDVVLLKPAPLPMVPPKPLPPLAPEPRIAQRETDASNRKAAEPLPQNAEPPSELREPEARPVALTEARIEPTFNAAPPQPAETRNVAAEARTEKASVPRDAAAVTPPLLNAAYLRNPAPRYPLIARRNGEQGTVTLRVLVTREGIPASVSVEKSSGFTHLDNAALETVKTWRFVPARHGAQPTEAWVLVPIVFRLEGSS